LKYILIILFFDVHTYVGSNGTMSVVAEFETLAACQAAAAAVLDPLPPPIVANYLTTQ
jgi:hypothetical protein